MHLLKKRMNELGCKSKSKNSMFDTSVRQYLTKAERDAGQEKWINRRTGEVVNGGDEISICETDDSGTT